MTQKQTILVEITDEERKDRQKNGLSTGSFKVVLPKVINNVSTFEMQFGMRSQHLYFCGSVLDNGIKPQSLPKIENKVKL